MGFKGYKPNQYDGLSCQGNLEYWEGKWEQLGKPQGTMLIELLGHNNGIAVKGLMYVASIASERGSPFCELADQRGLEKKLTVEGIPEVRGALKAFGTIGMTDHALVPRTEDGQTLFDMYFPK